MTNSLLSYNQRDISVTIAGLENSGKTMLVNKLLKREEAVSHSTFGVNQELYVDEGIAVGLTDLGGRESFRKTLWKSFISKSDALIYVADATKLDEILESKKWFLRSISWLNNDKPVLVVFNKWKKQFKNSELKAIVDLFKEGVTRKNIDYVIASIETGKNIDKAVDWIASSLIQRLIVDKVVVDKFIIYIKSKSGVLEVDVTSPKKYPMDDILSPIIRYKFAETDNISVEYLSYNDRQFIMAANKEISCWLVTSKDANIRSSNILIKLLIEFVSEIQGIKENKMDEEISSYDLGKFIINHLIDKQIFWSKDLQPLFEITLVDSN